MSDSSRVAKQVGELGRAVSGALLMIGRSTGGNHRVGIGKFTKEFVKYGKGLGQLQRTIYHFVPSGKNAGGGRLSYGMAQAAKIYIRGGLTDAKLRDKRYRGPDILPNGDLYAEWKSKIDLGNLPGKLTGTMAANFGVISNKAGGHSLGIPDSAKTRAPVTGRIPIEYSKKTSYIKDYAWALEFGTSDQPARPLMTGLAAGYLEKVDPEWARLFKKLMEDVYWDFATDDVLSSAVSLTESSGDNKGREMDVGPTGISGSYGTTSLARQFDAIADLYKDVAASAKSVDKFLQYAADESGRFKGQLMVQAKFMNIGSEMLQQVGDYSMEEIAEILHGVLKGDYKGGH